MNYENKRKIQTDIMGVIQEWAGSNKIKMNRLTEQELSVMIFNNLQCNERLIEDSR